MASSKASMKIRKRPTGRRPWSRTAPRKQESGDHIEVGGSDGTHHIEPTG